jgi:hypothetical protein
MSRRPRQRVAGGGRSSHDAARGGGGGVARGRAAARQQAQRAGRRAAMVPDGDVASGTVGDGGVGRSGARRRLSVQGQGGGRGNAGGCSWRTTAASAAAQRARPGWPAAAQVHRKDRCFILLPWRERLPCVVNEARATVLDVSK